MTKPFAEIAFDFQIKLSEFEDTLLEKSDDNFDFSHLSFDWYNCSLIIMSVTNDTKLNYEQLQYIIDSQRPTANRLGDIAGASRSL